jgi:hypothetical protein
MQNRKVKRYNALRTDHPKMKGPNNWDGMITVTFFNDLTVGTCYDANLAYSSIKEAKRYFTTFLKIESFRKKVYG